MQEIILDVSELPAPEPFDKIMQALVVLDSDQYLRVVHRKQPLLLYRPLLENGFDFHVQKGRVQAFDIFIWHKQQLAPEGLILPSIADIQTSPNKCSDQG